MRKEVKFIFLLFLLNVLSMKAYAAKRYWVAPVDSLWNVTANWSATSGGAGGSSVPGSNDTAYFNSGANFKCTINATVSVKRLEMQASFTDTIVQGANAITIGTSGAVLSGGVFMGGSSTITVTGTFTISGSVFVSTSGTFTTSANFTFTNGTFTHNSGKMKFTATNTITGSATYYQLEFAPSATSTFTIAAGTTITVANLLSLTGSAAATINTGAISAHGGITVTNSSAAGGGSATITINGSGTQTLTGSTGRLPNVTINKSASDTIKLVSTITVAGNWVYTAGIISAGTSTVYFDGTNTISGTHTLKNVKFSTGTHTISSGTLTVDSTLTIDGTTINTGAISAKGNISISSAVVTGGGTATITINGTGNQTITGNSTASTDRLPSVVINKASGTLTLVNTISIDGNWTYTAGTLSPGSSTVAFYDTKTITGSHTLANVKFGGSTVSTYTIASGTILTVSGTLTTTGSLGITWNTGDIYAQGDITLGNTPTTGGGSATITINGTGAQAFAGISTGGQGKMPNVVIDKSSGTLTLSNTITVKGDWTHTNGTINPGSSTVYFISTKTISGSHALNNVTFDGSAASTYTIASGTTFTVKGTLATNGANAVTINTGTIDAQGDISITNTATGATGSANIVINGTGTQTFTGSGVAGQGRLPHISVDKTFGQLNLASTISIYGGWTFIRDKVNATIGAATVVFYGTFNVDGEGTGGTMPFFNVTIGSGTTTLTGNLDADNNLTINSGATLSAGSNAVSVGGSWDSQGTWTYGTSHVTFNGTGYRLITGVSGSQVNFYNITFNKTTNSISLGRPLKVNSMATFTEGHVKATSTNYFEFANNATLSGGNDSAYIHGPVRKTGDDAFIFPLGDTTLADTAYHPLAMTAPSSTGDQFEATYFAVNYLVGDSLVDSLASVNQNEYWTMERKAGSSNVTVTLGWNKNSDINDIGSLRVAAWNGTKWLDYGQGTVSISWPRGTVAATNALTFSPNPIVIVIGVSKSANFGYATLKRKLDGGFYEAKSNSLYFKFDDEYNDLSHHLSYKILDGNNTNFAPGMIPSTNNLASSYYGDNRFRLDLYSTFLTMPSGYYILEVTNEKDEKFYLRFHKS